MSSKAVYFNDPVTHRPTKFDVLATNADKTVDLGIAANGEEKARVVVGSCPVSTEPKPGHCVLEVEGAESAEKKSSKK